MSLFSKTNQIILLNWEFANYSSSTDSAKVAIIGLFDLKLILLS